MFGPTHYNAVPLLDRDPNTVAATLNNLPLMHLQTTGQEEKRSADALWQLVIQPWPHRFSRPLLLPKPKRREVHSRVAESSQQVGLTISGMYTFGMKTYNTLHLWQNSFHWCT